MGPALTLVQEPEGGNVRAVSLLEEQELAVCSHYLNVLTTEEGKMHMNKAIFMSKVQQRTQHPF